MNDDEPFYVRFRMQLTGHKTAAVYRRYAIVSEGDLGAGLEKLGEFATGTKAPDKSDGREGERFRRTR